MDVRVLIHEWDNIIRKTWKGINQTKMEGGQSGTYLRLTIGVVGSAGERRRHSDETKKKNRIIEALNKNTVFLVKTNKKL